MNQKSKNTQKLYEEESKLNNNDNSVNMINNQNFRSSSLGAVGGIKRN